MLVTDRQQCGGELIPAVEAAVLGGVHAVQLREKDLPAGELLVQAMRLRASLHDRVPLLVNDRVDVAVAVAADGVHLPENGLPVAEARLLLRHPQLIGRSVHSVEGARAAEAEDSDYVIFGNVYETGSHPGAPAAGLTLLAEVVRVVHLPVLAIGGITAERAPDVMATGAAGIAVISAILAAPDRRRAASQLLAAIR
jgi:thiamine-phosphate diphosphorylase